MASPAQLYGNLTVQLVSTGTGNVQTHTPADIVSHMIISVETTSARVTIDGSTPSSGNGHVIPAGALPFYVPLGRSSVVKVCSTAGTNAVVNITDIVA